MIKQVLLVTLCVIALSATACSQIQLPTSILQLPPLPTFLQPSVAPNPASDTAGNTNTPSTASGSGPQTGQKPGKGAQAPAGLADIFHRMGWEAGVVAKTSSDQIGLRTVKNGPDKIAIGSSTIIVVPGYSNASISDIHQGDRIIADVPQGQTTAAFVMDVPKDYDKGNLMLGMVQSTSNGSITLRTRGGSDTLTTSSTTQVIKVMREGVALGSVNDLQNGNLVVVVGQTSGNDFAAQVVFALPKGLFDQGKGFGKDKKNSTPPNAPNSGG